MKWTRNGRLTVGLGLKASGLIEVNPETERKKQRSKAKIKAKVKVKPRGYCVIWQSEYLPTYLSKVST